MTSRRKTRELAFIALYQLEVGGYDPDELIDATIQREDISSLARPFFRTLVRGAWKAVPRLDPLIDRCATGWRVERLAKVELSILRLGAYELTHPVLDEKADTAVVINEAVTFAKKYASDESGKFINGILGKVAEMPEPFAGIGTVEEPAPTPKRDFTQKLSKPPAPGVRPVGRGHTPLTGTEADELPSGPSLPPTPRGTSREGGPRRIDDGDRPRPRPRPKP